MMVRKIGRGVAAFCAIAAFASSMTVHAEEAAFIRAGRLIDVEKETVLTDQLIEVRDGRIVSVKPFAPMQDVAIIDWSHYTVLPGLADMHTHLVGDIQGGIIDPLLYTGAEDVLAGAGNAKKTLCAGFTTVRDVGSWRAFTDVALRDAINRGDVEGPRMAVAGGYFTIPGGGGAITGLAYDAKAPEDMTRGVVRGPEDARQKAREFLQHRVDLLKMIATGAVLTVGTDPGLPELSEEEMRAIVGEAKKYGKKVTAHAHGAEGAKMAVRAGVDSIEHGSLLDDEALRMMKSRGVFLVADIYNGDYINEVGTAEDWPEETMQKNRDTTDTQREVFRKAVRMGVKIAYGTDSGVYPHGDNAKQMPYMVRYGMRPMRAIQSATLHSAALLGWEKDTGALSAGRYADMIAVEGDPLEDISILSHVKGVIKGGREVHCK
ncbi:Xaa-Pro dipeptidase [Hyphococcus sp.]|uniref:Xaa-Pro dipeptidase n=1 Tax=Hyphococcus sp. TaxID=2038636 RepID=UPI0035C67BB4